MTIDIYTRLINGKKYLKLHDHNYYKSISLEDNVYFTLRDLFLNISHDITICMNVVWFTEKLTNYTFYEDRKIDFKYSNMLNNKLYLQHLLKFLNQINEDSFEFIVPPEDIDIGEEAINAYYDINLSTYLILEDWLCQLEFLKKCIKEKIENLNFCDDFPNIIY